MDKQKLLQLYHIRNEIKLLKEQIDNVQCDAVTDSVKGSDCNFPYVEHTIKITGIDVDRYDYKVKKLKRELERRMQELIDTKTELNEYIEKIEDSEIRQIFTLRYIENLTWKQIAAKFGTKGEGDTERKKHDRFLKVSDNS